MKIEYNSDVNALVITLSKGKPISVQSKRGNGVERLS